MEFSVPDAFLAAPRKSITLLGMSGVGKTFLASLLKEAGWFHYGVDYRIASRYMGEAIASWIQAQAFQNPFLKGLWRRGALSIAPVCGPSNIVVLSEYLGKPGNPDLGGLPFEEYVIRQGEHRVAEGAAMGDFSLFADRARTIGGYEHCVCDTSGSLCEIVDPNDPNDPILKDVAAHSLLLYIRGTPDHLEALLGRFQKSPKPIYYHPPLLRDLWATYLTEQGVEERGVVPDAFAVWAFEKLLSHRLPRYESIAKNWGYTIAMEDLAGVSSAPDVMDLISKSICDAH